MWTWAIAIPLGLVVLFLMVRRAFPGGLKAGDFFSVAIPKSANPPLAMGTRLDVMAALKKRGVAEDEIRRLGDGSHDQELLDRYWAEQPTTPSQ